jgi:hypothetical protein
VPTATIDGLPGDGLGEAGSAEPRLTRDQVDAQATAASHRDPGDAPSRGAISR